MSKYYVSDYGHDDKEFTITEPYHFNRKNDDKETIRTLGISEPYYHFAVTTCRKSTKDIDVWLHETDIKALFSMMKELKKESQKETDIRIVDMLKKAEVEA